MDKKFEDVYSGMTFNYDKMDGVLGDLYQHLQDNPEDEMARDLFNRLCVICENMVYSQKEFTNNYGDPSIKNGLIGNLDSKIGALHEAKDKLKQQNL